MEKAIVITGKKGSGKSALVDALLTHTESVIKAQKGDAVPAALIMSKKMVVFDGIAAKDIVIVHNSVKQLATGKIKTPFMIFITNDEVSLDKNLFSVFQINQL